MTTENRDQAIQTPGTPTRVKRPPSGWRLLQMLLWILLTLVTLGIISAGTLVLADVSHRRRVSQEQAVLATGGHYLVVNGALVHFRQAGPTPEKSTPYAAPAVLPSASDSSSTENLPLVLIHGLMGSSQDFEFIQPLLARQRTVIAVDLIGFGLSDKSTALSFSKRSMADTVAGLMSELGYNRYDVLGHSMGGEVALNIALYYRDRVSRLILLDSAGTMQTGAPSTATAAGSGDPAADGSGSNASPLLIDLVFKNYFVERQVFKTCLYETKPYMPLAFDKLYYFAHQIPAETLARFIADSDSGRIASRLGEISQPTRIIWGETDRIIPLPQGQALAAAIPGSDLKVIAHSGHLPYLEKPAELVSLIDEFLDKWY